MAANTIFSDFGAQKNKRKKGAESTFDVVIPENITNWERKQTSGSRKHRVLNRINSKRTT